MQLNNIFHSRVFGCRRTAVEQEDEDTGQCKHTSDGETSSERRQSTRILYLSHEEAIRIPSRKSILQWGAQLSLNLARCSLSNGNDAWDASGVRAGARDDWELANQTNRMGGPRMIF